MSGTLQEEATDPRSTRARLSSKVMKSNFPLLALAALVLFIGTALSQTLMNFQIVGHPLGTLEAVATTFTGAGSQTGRAASGGNRLGDRRHILDGARR